MNNLPELFGAAELVETLNSFNKQIVVRFKQINDPVLKDIYKIIEYYGAGIVRYLKEVKIFLQKNPDSSQTRFVLNFFSRNFSVVSQNTRAARKIIEYVLANARWFNLHADRIIDTLKSLYAQLIALQIDCREIYRLVHNAELDINFYASLSAAAEYDYSAVDINTSYKLLSLPPNAGLEEIKHSFRLLVKQKHPDLNPEESTEEFIKIEQAYKRLLSLFRAHG